MDIDEIKALMEAMSASDLQVMEVERDGWSLRLTRGQAAAASPSLQPSPAPVASARSRPTPRAAAEFDPHVRSPLSGVVHLRPNPDAAPFVEPGRQVSPGDVLCLVEAMKMFNEVRAERAGTIGEVLVSSGEEVEAGQPLLALG